MKRSKKLILSAVVAGVVLVTAIGVVAFAQADDAATGKTLLSRVAAILGIEQTKVEEAFAQAQKDMQSEAMDTWLNALVADGKLTQGEADQYKQWVQARPDLPEGFGMRGFGGPRGGEFRFGIRGGPGMMFRTELPETQTVQ